MVQGLRGVVGACLLSIVAGEAAADGFFLDSNGAAALREDGERAPAASTLDDGVLFEGSAGYRAGGERWTIRLGADLTHRRDAGRRWKAPAGTEMDATSLLASARLDLPDAGGLKPYVGGGLGAAWVSYDAAGDGAQFEGDGQLAPAMQLGAGLGIAVAPNVALRADYRLFVTDLNPERAGSLDGVAAHTVLAGVTIAF